MAGTRTVEIMVPDDATIGQLFRIARAVAGWTPSQAARVLDLSPKTYLKIEHGDRLPRRLEVREFALATGQSMELFEDASLAEQHQPRTPALMPAAATG